MTDTGHKPESAHAEPPTIYIQFSDTGTICEWSHEPFEGGAEYARVHRDWACVVDGEDDPDSTCVIDGDRHHDCLYAKPGMCRTDCKYWQHIKTARNGAKP